MVKHVACVIIALTVLASARPPDDDRVEHVEPESDDPAFNLFGFRTSVGALPIDGGDTLTFSLGLGVEHPVFTKTRVFGEYEWMWLLDRNERAMDTIANAPRRHGNGHRASLGLRRELIGKRKGSALRLFIDGELGGGVALTNENMAGVEVMPDVFAGLRFGYDLYSRSEDSPSRTFEAEFLLRAVAIRDGIGMLFGVGMLWGN